MQGKRQFKITKRMFVSAAEMLPVCLFDLVLFSEPLCDLEIGNNHCAGTFGNGNAVAHVITLSVTDKDKVGLNSFG
jgi:hypothetical protein